MTSSPGIAAGLRRHGSASRSGRRDRRRARQHPAQRSGSGGDRPDSRGLLQRLLAKDPRQRPTARETLDIARRLSDERVADSIGESARERRPLDPADRAGPPVAPPVAPAPVYRAPTPAARSNRTDWRKPVVIALAALLALVVGFVGFRALDSGGTDVPGHQSGGAGTGCRPGPAFPGSNQLRSGDWLLSQYSIGQDNGKLTVDGTVVNSGDEAASTDLTVYYTSTANR